MPGLLRDPVERALASAVAALALSRGMFFAVSALYFTRGVGLSPTAVGIGLTVAGAVGVLASYAGGWLSDRCGADRLQQWALAANGVALLGYALARDVVTFVLVAACVSASRGLQSTAQMTLLARWYVGPERVAVRARLRVVMNVGIGIGTLLAGLALVVDTATAYRLTVVLVGAITTLGTIPLAGLRRRVSGLAERMDASASTEAPRGPSPLKDRTYVTSTVLNALLAIHFALTSVGIPLWVADHTEAPTVVVSALLVVNTAYVALFQVRASRGTQDLRTAGRSVRRAGLLLLAACLLFALAGHLGAAAATGVLLLGALASSAGETRGEAGSWGMAFELADPARAGAYQGLSQTGLALALMLGPAVVTTTAIDHGTLGWIALGALFALTGTATALLANRAARSTGAEAQPADGTNGAVRTRG
ncbi:MFS transporter [Kribbella sp. VKM Ac-2571]|uniref:MFS transporter n=1 Tax=Kribbella sp. VKM Ac-2571 TaxID=2512222 RepID=UPI001060FFAE|nr:MFS transporter [Kribbella sp. VKM Ac-2571]TDO52977.1 MFS transporter [Kribbella sp. VKM Ac-2571]